MVIRDYDTLAQYLEMDNEKMTQIANMADENISDEELKYKIKQITTKNQFKLIWSFINTSGGIDLGK